MLLWGVDFSGARFPARAVWIAEACIVSKGLQIKALRSLAYWEGVTPRSPLAQCLMIFKQRLLAIRPACVGLDFPFSLPNRLLDAPNYSALLQSFPKKFPTVIEFERFCRKWRPQPWRLTDIREHAPMSPCNLRLFRQTYWGITEILIPLWAKRGIRILPFQHFRTGDVHLIEVCPASLLKRNGQYKPYQGNTARHRQQRYQLVRWLKEAYSVQMTHQQIAVIVEQAEGDALDALLGVLVPYQLLKRYGEIPLPAHPIAAIEGWIYSA